MRRTSKLMFKKPKKPAVVLNSNEKIRKNFLKQIAESTLGCSESGILGGQSPTKAYLEATFPVVGY